MGYSGVKWLKMVNLHINNIEMSKILIYNTLKYIVDIRSVFNKKTLYFSTLCYNLLQFNVKKTLTHIVKSPYIVL